MIKKIFTTILLLGLLWINLPASIPIKFTVGKLKVDTKIEPTIDFTIAGRRITKTFTNKFGLDLQGGTRFLFDVDTSKIKKDDVADAIAATASIVERRVNLFGVAEPSVQLLKSGGNHQIAVELPGVTESQSSVSQIGKTALLEFKSEGALMPDVPISIATTSAIFKLTKKTGLEGKHVKKAQVVFNTQNGAPNVQLTFNSEGTKLFSTITKDNLGKPIAITLDDQFITWPTVQSQITDGTALITGNFTVEQAKELAISINSGALPAPLRLVSQKTVGPTLGSVEVQRSFYAGVVGLLAVLLFMILYYGKMGVISAVGLVLYALISQAIYRSIPIVLTLPGIAGFILSIGMAVDSNILIFERIKEEIRAGKPRSVAMRLGFGRAWDAIKDANITTILVAIILYNPLNWDFLPQFGLIRGFALTLILGVFTSLFTGVFITRRLLQKFYK